MKKKLLSGVIALVIVVGGGFLLIKNYQGNNQAALFTATDRLQKGAVMLPEVKAAKVDMLVNGDTNSVSVAQAPTQNPPVAAGGTAPINVTPAPSTCPASGYKYVTQWGSYGSGNSQFAIPGYIAVNSSGDVYVYDARNNRVQKFTSSGQYILQWGTQGSANGQFQVPNFALGDSLGGIAIDMVGHVYVVDTGNNRVEKFDSQGNYITQWGALGAGNGQLNGPGGVTVDLLGNVYVVDRYNNRVQKFKSNGTYLSQFGTGSSASGQFSNPTGIDNDIFLDTSGNIYVTSLTGYGVKKFSSTGQYVSQIGSQGYVGNGKFMDPVGVDIDSYGNVYVVDSYQERVQKFDQNGTYIAQLGSSGYGNGQFRSPIGIAISSQGNIYVTDSNNHRIQKFAPCTPVQVQANTAKSIRGKVYNDRNTNGTFDGADTALANAKVSLFPLGQNSPIQTITASSTGEYSFTNLANGTYYVGLWSETYYSNITQPATGSGIVPAHAHVYTVTISNGQGVTNKDFGVVAITTY